MPRKMSKTQVRKYQVEKNKIKKRLDEKSNIIGKFLIEIYSGDEIDISFDMNRLIHALNEKDKYHAVGNTLQELLDEGSQGLKEFHESKIKFLQAKEQYEKEQREKKE